MANTQTESLDQLVDSWASIRPAAFKATPGVFLGLALLSVSARVVIRVKTRQPLAVDDYFLFAGAAFLIATACTLYKVADELYLAMALQRDPALAFEVGNEQLQEIIQNSAAYNIAVIVVCWMATFCVKFSFLAYFKQLILNVRNIQCYYWTVVGITAVSCAFLVSEPFILCPYFGVASTQCLQSTRNELYISLTGLVTGLDVLTDVLILSIPMVILKNVKIRPKQKAVLGAFLGLSLFMVIFAIIRASKMRGAAGVDIPWEFFWMFMEAAIAVIMGSLTAFRTLLVLHATRNQSEEERRMKQMNTFIRMRESRSKVALQDLEGQRELPGAPDETMATSLSTLTKNGSMTPPAILPQESQREQHVHIQKEWTVEHHHVLAMPRPVRTRQDSSQWPLSRSSPEPPESNRTSFVGCI